MQIISSLCCQTNLHPAMQEKGLHLLLLQLAATHIDEAAATAATSELLQLIAQYSGGAAALAHPQLAHLLGSAAARWRTVGSAEAQHALSLLVKVRACMALRRGCVVQNTACCRCCHSYTFRQRYFVALLKATAIINDEHAMVF